MPRYDREGKHSGQSERSGTMSGLLRAEKLTQIAFILPAAVLVGWLLGVGLDRWLHTRWIYIVGILFGVVAGFVQILRLIGRETK
jgi:ATP synthase protein I